MPSSDPSVYVECCLLLAVMDDDGERADRLIGEMSPNERAKLVADLDRMRSAVLAGGMAASTPPADRTGGRP